MDKSRIVVHEFAFTDCPMFSYFSYTLIFIFSSLLCLRQHSDRRRYLFRLFLDLSVCHNWTI